MKADIYISTSVFRQKCLNEILSQSLEQGFTNIELGSNLKYAGQAIELLLKFKEQGMNFLLHNYFPAPEKDDFVLNLASDDREVFSRSIRHCKEAVDLSAKLGAAFYSVHSGFAFHASPGDLNRPQTALPRIPYEKAYGIFLEAVRELARYGARKGVKLALENNVVAEFNLSGGRNEILLLAEAEESLSFFKEAGSGNLFFLIDLGHLKVTSNVLKFDKDEYLKSIIPYVIGFHLDDNNGLVDEHRGFDESVWFRQILMENREKTFILEAQNLSRQGLKRNYLALESMLVKG